MCVVRVASLRNDFLHVEQNRLEGVDGLGMALVLPSELLVVSSRGRGRKKCQCVRVW